MNENTCICCGRVIPEGSHICLLCSHDNEMQTFKRQPVTNADKIRDMSDLELARYLVEAFGCDCHTSFKGCNECPRLSLDSMAKWLMSSEGNLEL